MGDAIDDVKSGKILLELDYEFSQRELKAAFRAASRKHHPDAGGDAEIFIKVKKAYTTLFEYTTEWDGHVDQTICGRSLHELGMGLGPTTNGADCDICNGKGYNTFVNWECDACGGQGRIKYYHARQKQYVNPICHLCAERHKRSIRRRCLCRRQCLGGVSLMRHLGRRLGLLLG